MSTTKTISKIERIRTGAKAFIVHEGKILVIKERVQRGTEFTTINDIPGGGIELGETIQEALHREVFEEVGLKIKIERPVGAWGWLLHNPVGGVHIVCLGYQCSVVGVPVVNVSNNPAVEDIFETAWLTKEEILAEASEHNFSNEDMRLSLENVLI